MVEHEKDCDCNEPVMLIIPMRTARAIRFLVKSHKLCVTEVAAEILSEPEIDPMVNGNVMLQLQLTDEILDLFNVRDFGFAGEDDDSVISTFIHGEDIDDESG